MKVLTMLFISMLTLVACQKPNLQKTNSRADDLLAYSQNLKSDIESLSRSENPDNGTLTADNDAAPVDECGTLISLGRNADGSEKTPTDTEIVDFHVCKIKFIISFLQLIDTDNDEQKAQIANQIARLEELLAELQKEDSEVRTRLIEGTRKILDDLIHGRLPFLSQVRPPAPPLPTKEERCQMLERAVSDTSLPESLRESLKKAQQAEGC